MPWAVAAAAAVGTIGAVVSASNQPSQPDYSQVSQADQYAADLQWQTSKDQLDWAKQTYADQAPRTAAYMDAMTQQTQDQTANAKTDRARYQNIYQPVEDNFVAQATNWNSPDRADQQAGMAKADVANSMGAARQASLSSLESYGIDPSQTRYGALDLSTRIQQASSQAAAGTQSRLNTEATGLALQGEAINIGKGYPGQVAQSYAGATQAGAAGINAGNSTASTYGNLMGTGTQWASLGNQSEANVANTMHTGYGDAMAGAQFSAQQWGNASNGLGNLVGGALMMSKMGMFG